MYKLWAGGERSTAGGGQGCSTACVGALCAGGRALLRDRLLCTTIRYYDTVYVYCVVCVALQAALQANERDGCGELALLPLITSGIALQGRPPELGQARRGAALAVMMFMKMRH